MRKYVLVLLVFTFGTLIFKEIKYVLLIRRNTFRFTRVTYCIICKAQDYSALVRVVVLLTLGTTSKHKSFTYIMQYLTQVNLNVFR